jgi:hypothetical protein
MKEDKSDKWIASSLKKHLEEGELPYELGAWENFQKVRKARKHRTIFYWSVAVAASLLFLFAVSQAFLGQNEIQLQEMKVPVLADADQAVDSLNSLDFPMTDKSEEDQGMKETEMPEVNISEYLAETSKPENKQQAKVEMITELGANQNKTPELKAEEKIQEKQNASDVSSEKALAEEVSVNEKTSQDKPKNASGLIASQESLKLSLDNSENVVVEKESIAEETIATMPIDEDFPEIPKEHTKVYLGMGVSPGFGSFQQNNNTTTASSIGIGMLLNVDLPGKLTLGSGLGVNYMNQQNESLMPVTIAGYRTSQVEKQDIQQVQLEMPVYFKYPVTRNNSISVQAGFSNYYAINQNAEQQTTVNQQFVVNNSLNSNSAFDLASLAVSQTEALSNDESKFYPFATVNFGVNIRVLESEKVNYMVMPFYNHQLRSISGFGDNFGMFGASLKLNFGGSEK